MSIKRIDDDVFVVTFLRRVLDDRTSGRDLSLEDYVPMFPGREDVIRSAWRELADTSIESTAAAAEGSGTNAVERQLGPYRLIEVLGGGGQGQVYLAEDTRLKRKVAVKILHALAATSDEMRARFRREAHVASKLDHPGICALYDFGVEAAVPYIVMRYVEGEPLARVISRRWTGRKDRRGTLPEDPAAGAAPADSQDSLFDLVRVVEEAARAVHAAHESGVLHRDLKPANIMVTPRGEPVILDFGVASLIDGEASYRTRTGDVFGTPSYIAPEMLGTPPAPADRRSDVYALGVILYETITGGRPFEAPTRDGLYQAILRGGPPEPRSVNRSIPHELSVVVRTAIERDRDRRYQTALDLAEELRRVREFEPIHARAAGPIIRLRRWAQRNPALAAATTGLITVLAVGLGVALYSLGETRRERDAKVSALDLAMAERNAKDKALGEKGQALYEYDRLSDVPRLRQLSVEAATLYPAAPENIPKFKEWIASAEKLGATLKGHQDALAKLRAAAAGYADEDRVKDRATHTAELERRAQLEDARSKLEARLAGKNMDSRPSDRIQPGTRSTVPLPTSPLSREMRETLEDRSSDLKDEIAYLDAKIGERVTWRFRDDSPLQFKHDTLAALVRDLASFVDPDPKKGTLASVKERLAWAETVEKRTITDYADRWREAIRSVADQNECPAYEGKIRLKQEVGLIPIGRDPSSRLWEFAHLETTAKDAEPIPERGADGRLRISEKTGIVFILIPGGTFWMGAQKDDPAGHNYDPEAQSNESPVREVTLDSFFLSKYEMTQGQWERATGDRPSLYGPGTNFGGNISDLRHPVENVSWEQVTTALFRLGLVLPKEAQWEYAARAGSKTPWWTGDEKESLKGAANLADVFLKAYGGPPGVSYEPWLDDRYVVHAPVGNFLPNPFGLHDVIGNVWEWCRDGYGAYDEEHAAGEGGCPVLAPRLRVLRGGSFDHGAFNARSAYRDFDTPDYRNGTLGLRPARVLSQ